MIKVKNNRLSKHKLQQPSGNAQPEAVPAQGYRDPHPDHPRRDIGPVQRDLQVRVPRGDPQHRRGPHREAVHTARQPGQRRGHHRPVRAEPDHAVTPAAALR